MSPAQVLLILVGGSGLAEATGLRLHGLALAGPASSAASKGGAVPPDVA